MEKIAAQNAGVEFLGIGSVFNSNTGIDYIENYKNELLI